MKKLIINLLVLSSSLAFNANAEENTPAPILPVFSSIGSYNVPTQSGDLTAFKISANGQYAYAIGASNIYMYTLNKGKLSPLNLKTTGGNSIYVNVDPSDIVLSPDGKNLFVTSGDSSRIATYNINADGTLVPNYNPSIANTGNGLEQLVLNNQSGGSYAYALTQLGGVDIYSLNNKTGVLTKQSNFSLASTCYMPNRMIVSNSNKAYITCSGSILMLNIGSNGVMTLNTEVNNTTSIPTSLAFSPNQNYIYVGDGSGSGGGVNAIDIFAANSITQAPTVKNISAYPYAMVSSQKDNSGYGFLTVFLSGRNNQTFSTYLDGQGSILPMNGNTKKLNSSFMSPSVTLSPDSKYLFVVGGNSDNIYIYKNNLIQN